MAALRVLNFGCCISKGSLFLDYLDITTAVAVSCDGPKKSLHTFSGPLEL